MLYFFWSHNSINNPGFASFYTLPWKQSRFFFKSA
nr:MAG TPA: hypothetical protein [Caudoviricetes sp.]